MARPICEALKIRPELRDGLKEIAYGAWEGRTREEVTQKFHDDYLLWTADPAWNPPTGGETAVMVAQRAIRVIEEIIERFHDGNVLIISHKATIRIIICSLLGIDVGRFRYRLGCPVGSVSIIEFSNRGPLLHALADRMHLREALRNLPGTRVAFGCHLLRPSSCKPRNGSRRRGQRLTASSRSVSIEVTEWTAADAHRILAFPNHQHVYPPSTTRLLPVK
jgi:broad specificity phosphatase PhoE